MQATGADIGLQVSGYGRDVSLYIGLQAACTWIFHKVQAAFCITFGLCTAAPGNDRRAAQTQGRAQPVAGFGQHAVCNAQPEQGGDDVYAAVCRINPPAGGRMQGKQIGKQCKAGGGRQQQPRTFALPQPQIRQPAADDFGQRGKQEEQQGFEDGGVHG